MRIAVMGPLEIEDGARPITVPGAKERMLLALLAAEAPGVVSTDRLVESLWDGAPPATARKTVQAHVVRLRSSLEPERPKGSSGRYVVRRGPGYALAVGQENLDRLDFEDLAARGRAVLASGDPAEAERLLASAVAMWRGEPFGDWPQAPFAEDERHRLGEVRSATLAALFQARLALGLHAEVIPELRRLVSQEPLHEEWWRLLMLALYRAGRQADALAEGRRARTVLSAELGADPGPGLREMEAAVLAQDPTLDGPRSVGEPGPSSPAAAVAGGACPYKGLSAYQVADAWLFHGRARVVAALVARLVDTRLTVVAGASGAGKSSVLRAGLVPVLAAGAVPGGERWQPHVVTVGSAPVDLLAELTGESPPDEPVLLVCDQFEQLWAPGVEAAEQTAFLDAILGLLDDGIVARCVVVIRGDHVERLAEHPAFTERVGAAIMLIGPLSNAELREVVCEPAHAVGLTVDPELLDVVVDDVLGRVGALPLLSMALVGTWERRRGHRLTLAGYLEAGGVAAALSRSAEAAYAGLDEAGRAEARRLLVRLADTDERGVLVGRAVPLAELDLDGADGAGRREVVESFVSRRLLAVGERDLQVAHEALLTAWPRLARWLGDDEVGRAVRRHLAPAARDWAAAGRRGDELYRGARLSTALDWASGTDVLTPLEREFLEASQARVEADAAETRERARREVRARRRTQRLLVGLAALLVLALVATVLAVRYQRNAGARAAEAAAAARVADADRLATLSAAAGPLDVSLLLATQAVRLAPTAGAQDALLGALLDHGRAGRAVVSPGHVSAGMLGNGGRIVWLRAGGALARWPVGDSAAPRPVRSETGGLTGWLAGQASPTQDLLVATGLDVGGVWLRSVSAGGEERLLAQWPAGEGRPLALAFRGDGRAVEVLTVTGLQGGGAGTTLGVLRVREVGLADGALRDTSVLGTTTGRLDRLRADETQDGSGAVIWDTDAPTTAALVDLRNGHEVALRAEPRPVPSAGFRVFAGGAAQLWADGAVTLFDRDGTPVQQLQAHRAAVTDVALAPDGSWGITAGAGGAVFRWDVDPGTGLWSRPQPLPGHSADVLAAEVDPSGARLVTVAQDDRVIVWDMTAEGSVGAPYPGLAGRWMSAPPQVVVPGRLVVVPTRPVPGPGGDPLDPPADTTAVSATFLDPADGRVVAQVDVGETPVGAAFVQGFGSAVAVSPDRGQVAVSAGSRTTVLDASTRAVVATIDLPPPEEVRSTPPARVVPCLAWLPDGSRLLECSDGGLDSGGHAIGGVLREIDTSTWQEVAAAPINGTPIPMAVRPSPDGRFLAVAAGAIGMRILDADSLRIVNTVNLGADVVDDLRFSADGRYVAAAGLSGLLYVVDTRTWSLAREPTPLGAPLLQVEWLPDGRSVAVAALDGTASLVDVDRGRVRARLPATGTSTGTAAYVRLLPAPSHDLVAFSEQTGRRYPLDVGVWLRKACDVVARDLTRTEWQRYLPERPYRPTCSDLP